jgi:hypothetical protein
MNHLCDLEGHQYGTLVDEHDRRLCDRCGRVQCPLDATDDATDAYESADCLEDAFDALLDMPSDGVIDERCDNW